MSLSEQSRKVTEAFIASQPDNVQTVIVDAFKDLVESTVGEQALNRGDQATDFSLPNATGKHTSLTELLEDGPVVLSFYRGGWCPFCNLEFKALHDILPQIKGHGAQLVGVSPETPDNTMATAERHQLQFEVLSDVGNQVARDYGILMNVHPELRSYYLEWGFNLPELNGDDSFELPIPATYIIDADGVIHTAYINKDYTQRMEPEAILQALQSL
jgi:peroxiredoxin